MERPPPLQKKNTIFNEYHPDHILMFRSHDLKATGHMIRACRSHDLYVQMTWPMLTCT